jgi:hypothetical protein
MTRLAIHCAVLVAAGWLRASTLEDTSKWPDLVDSAKERGINYPATVENARHGDVAALAILFRHTSHTDGSAADSHCAVLRHLLELLGDQKFGGTLQQEPASVRSKVTEALDFDFGHPWQKQFPLTYALGSHNSRLLKPHNGTNQSLEPTAGRCEVQI